MLYIIWTLLFLAVCTVTDLREQRVYSLFCFINITIALIVHFAMSDVHWLEILSGMLLGGIFWIVSICTKEAMGQGDAIVIFTLGSIIGIKVCFEIVAWASLICALISIGGMFIKKVNLKSCIPFVPFMMLGAIITFVMEGI